ncbi:excinuclease ABC subunit UvrA [Ruminococcus sp. OA3]|uniref:ATP-binding cassette domain-containing protein n=1 Tax=Ruminococcus sp. OA3 TaxID=2914164 RepID=UPI001F05862A|nr:excinuclease ABC subunit UvrA [Ruminococcus sp. OA3]MCH1981921.1 excinuclease ABC subunit UvrA [Ruminococcus sp. OA3]
MPEFIKIRGARENNLKNISLDIPKGKIVAFVGVSGSGKTSIVFDTVASESMRQLYETFPPYVRNRMPYYQAPEADEICNLTTAIVIDQKTYGGDVRSTAGTMTDISPMLRILFSRCADHSAGASSAYSFNDPSGMCPVCSGLGRTVRFNMDRVLDMKKSLNEGAIRLPGFQIGTYQWQMYANSGRFDIDKPLKDYTEEELDFFLHGSDLIVEIKNTTGKVWDSSYNLTYEGLLDRIDRLYLNKAKKTAGKAAINLVHDFTDESECPYCHGTRLKPEALDSKIAGYSIWDMGQMEVTELISVLQNIEDPGIERVAEKIVARLKDIDNIGLGYLNLNRAANTLSGGEAQRLKIVRHLGSGLVGITYIFDEPSAGLHPRDIVRLNTLMKQLRDRGNTVLVVEHNRAVIDIADEVIEVGPKAGRGGGSIIFQGNLADLMKADTPTGHWFRDPAAINQNPRKSRNFLELRNCNMNNLKNIDVNIPVHALTAVTGIAGSGKSSLVCGELIRQYQDVIHISQSPIGANSRSNPASYIGIMDDIRREFARASGKGAGWFSFNSRGACPVCRGKGIVMTEMAFMDPVTVACEACGGKRYNDEALSHRYCGKTIAEVLDMTVADAMEFFRTPKITAKLRTLSEVGLDYLTLGQPTSTLSGGECQRIKLAAHLKNKNGIYVMDEPASGLHGIDIRLLMRLLNRLVDNGNTVIVVEHRYDVICQADWIIDMGPSGGTGGGEIIFEGTVRDLLHCENSFTAKYMKREI